MARITETVKKETHDTIIDEARKLFELKGFEKTKTKDIAKACHIAEGTLFNYFETKDEILIAVFEHMANESLHSSDNLNLNPLEQLKISIFKPIEKLNVLPKSLLVDLLSASLKIAKKRPKLFKKLMDIDFSYIQSLEAKLLIYCDFNQHTIDANDLAEMIYGVIATDFIIYLYESTYSYALFYQKAEKKLTSLIKPYLKEVLSNDSM